MATLQAVVIGTGFIGPVHVEALRRIGVNVRGIVGSSQAKTRDACERLGVETMYESFEHVLRDPRVDVVHITTPNALHFPQVKRALEAGKHILCEKPLAMTANESVELVRLAAESKCVTGVNYNIRYYPLCQQAATAVREGEVGKLLHVAGSYVQDWLLFPTDYNWRVEKELGGELRAIADIGSHWLDLIQFVCDQTIVAVCADLATMIPTRYRPTGGVQTFGGSAASSRSRAAVTIDTEDYGAVLFRLSGGARGVMWVSQVTAGRKNCCRFELAGESRACAWESELPNQLWIGNRDQANEQLLKDPALLHPAVAASASYPGGHNEGFADTFKQLFRAFYDHVQNPTHNGSPTFPTFEDGHRELVLGEAILRSSREARWVSVAEHTE